MQKEKPSIVSIKKVLNIINSTETKKQLYNCKNVIENYIVYLQKREVDNTESVRNRLFKEYNQKKFQLNMINLFVKRSRKEFNIVLDKVLA